MKDELQICLNVRLKSRIEHSRNMQFRRVSISHNRSAKFVI